MSNFDKLVAAYKNALYTTNHSCGIDGYKVSNAVWNDPSYQRALKDNFDFFYDIEESYGCQ